MTERASEREVDECDQQRKKRLFFPLETGGTTSKDLKFVSKQTQKERKRSTVQKNNLKDTASNNCRIQNQTSLKY